MSPLSGPFRLIVPNTLTIARIGLAAAFPFADPNWWPLILLLGAVSDAVDGAFSRLFHSTSTFGQILDPIADKLFIGSVLVTLMVVKLLSIPTVLLVGARDLAVVLGVVVALGLRGWPSLRRMPPHWLGKAATALQFTFLFWVVYDRTAPVWLLAVTGTMSFAAGIRYLRSPHWKRPDQAAHCVTPDDETVKL